MLDEKMVKGKEFLGEPTCTLQGKEIPVIITMTPTGNVTIDILAQVNKYIDDLGVCR